MRIRSMLFAVVSAAVLAACSTATQVQTAYRPQQGEKVRYEIVSRAEVSEEALGILRARLDQQLAQGGRLAQKPDEAGSTVHVTITGYRMRHGAARALAGIFAGTDNMQSSVEVKDAASGSVRGRFDVTSSNATAWGTSRGMIEDHADQIATQLNGTAAK